MSEAERGIKEFLGPRMYRHERVMRVMNEAAQVVRDLFAHYAAMPCDMPEEWRLGLSPGDEAALARRAGDFIAGMTDRFALADLPDQQRRHDEGEGVDGDRDRRREPGDQRAAGRRTRDLGDGVDGLALAVGVEQALAGDEISLADLYLAPIMAYMALTPHADEFLKDGPLAGWWTLVSARDSFAATTPSSTDDVTLQPIAVRVPDMGGIVVRCVVRTKASPSFVPPAQGSPRNRDYASINALTKSQLSRSGAKMMPPSVSVGVKGLP